MNRNTANRVCQPRLPHPLPVFINLLPRLPQPLPVFINLLPLFINLLPRFPQPLPVFINLVPVFLSPSPSSSTSSLVLLVQCSGIVIDAVTSPLAISAAQLFWY
ncbi:hypothetical protein LSAT2_027810, partial [Lamellibrachia satsuma]